MWRLGWISGLLAVAGLLSAVSEPAGRRLQRLQSPRIETARHGAPPAPEEISGLCALLGDRDPHVRFEAAERLIAAGGPAARLLLEGLRDIPPPVVGLIEVATECWVRRATLRYALVKLGMRAVPELVAALDDKQLHDVPVDLLAEIARQDERVVRHLLPLLDEEDCSAAWAMGDVGPNAAAAIPRLVRLLGVEPCRYAAVRSLKMLGAPAVRAVVAELKRAPSKNLVLLVEEMGPAAAAAVPQLVRLAREGSTPALRALKAMGPAANQAMGALVELGAVDALIAVGADSGTLEPLLMARLRSGRALTGHETRFLRHRAAEVVPLLIENMRKDDNSDWCFVGALAGLGPDAVPDLIARVETGQKEARVHYVRALGKIGAPEAIPVLRSLLFDADEEVQRAALHALGGIGAPARSAAREVESLFSGPLKCRAAWCHWELTGDAGPATAVYEGVLEAPVEHLHKLQAIDALLKMGAAAEPYRPWILQGLELKSSFERNYAARLLRRARAAPADVRQYLDDGEVEVRVTAAAILARAGEDADAVLPVLMEGVRPVSYRNMCGGRYTRAAFIRVLAIETLQDLGARCAIPVPFRVRLDGNGNVAAAARDALAALASLAPAAR